MVGKKSGRALLRDEGTSLHGTLLPVTFHSSSCWLVNAFENLRVPTPPARPPKQQESIGVPKRHLADISVTERNMRVVNSNELSADRLRLTLFFLRLNRLAAHG